jgi:hypothetical protein
MKIGSWNKMPVWVRFLAVLLGIPLVAGLLRGGFEHWFHGLTAKVLALVSLGVLWLFLHWTFKSCPAPAPMSKEETKREERKVDFVVALLYAVIFLAGGVIFLVIAVLPPTDLPSLSRWVIRVASLFFGLLGLVLSLSFIFQCRFLVTGKKSLTMRHLTIGFGHSKSKKGDADDAA